MNVALRFEDNPRVEFGEGEFDPNLRNGENGIGDKDFVCPHVAAAGVDDGVDAILLEHDVALDGRRRLIFAGLDDRVIARGARTEDFEDDDGVINDSGGSVDRGAHDHAVGIADVAFRDLEFEIAAVEAARTAAKARPEGVGQIGLNVGVPDGSAGHCDGTDTVEFIAQGLPFLPIEEFGEHHRSWHDRFIESNIITNWR